MNSKETNNTVMNNLLNRLRKILCSYDNSNIDVVFNDETNTLDIIYHSRHNSFGFPNATYDAAGIDLKRLETELDKLDVGYVW